MENKDIEKGIASFTESAIYCLHCKKEIPLIFTKHNHTQILTCSFSCEMSYQKTLKHTEDPKELSARRTALKYHGRNEQALQLIQPLIQEPNYSEEGFAWDEVSLVL